MPVKKFGGIIFAGMIFALLAPPMFFGGIDQGSPSTALAYTPLLFVPATGTLSLMAEEVPPSKIKVINAELLPQNLGQSVSATEFDISSTLFALASSTFLNYTTSSAYQSFLNLLLSNPVESAGTALLLATILLGVIGLLQQSGATGLSNEVENVLAASNADSSPPAPLPPVVEVPKYPPNLYRWEGYNGDILIKQYVMLVNGVWHPVTDPASIENIYGNILDQIPNAAGLMERFSTSGGAQTFLKSWQMQSEVLETGSLPITPEAFARGEKGTRHPLGWSWRPIEMIDPKTKIIYSVDTNAVVEFENAFGWRRTNSGLFTTAELGEAFRSFEGFDTIDAYIRGIAYTTKPSELAEASVGVGAPTAFQQYFAAERAAGKSAKNILADNPFMFKPTEVVVVPKKISALPKTKKTVVNKVISAIKGIKIMSQAPVISPITNAAPSLPATQLAPKTISFWDKLKNNAAMVAASSLAIVGATLVTFAANETLGAVNATNKLPATWETSAGKTAANTASLYLSKLEINVGADLFKKAAIAAPLALAGVPETAGGSLMIDWTALAGASVLGSHGAGVVAYMAETNTKASADTSKDGSANSAINITDKGLQHVVDSHTIKTVEDVILKSKFFEGTNIPELIKIAEKSSPTLQGNGNYVRILDAGRVIGTDVATGKATSFYTVVTDIKNDLVTAHPGKPFKLY